MNLKEIKLPNFDSLLNMSLIYNISMPTGHFIRSEEHKRHISESLKGKSHYWGVKIKKAFICPCGESFLLTPGQIRKGHGKYCSRKCYFKYRDCPNFLKKSKLKGEDSINWKGDNVKYAALHLRVQIKRGKATVCEKCGSLKRVEWANKTGKYADVFDYISLCKKCHGIFDNIYRKGWITRRNKSSSEANGNITREGGVVAA